MIRTKLAAFALCLLAASTSGALADDELITVRSAHSASVTIQRLHIAIILNEWTIFATIDHAAHAANYAGVRLAHLLDAAMGK